jgi:5-oxopent-3-ene-1,2,5-tricarboxylate decarboxylase / 2-hydroxyhepta-2,4-diene-1,7-dioate isomerase
MRSPSTGYWPQGTIYGTLLNFNAERAQMAEQMTQPPYKAPPKAPVLFIKTANTLNASGGVVQVPANVPEIEIGATFGIAIRASAQLVRARAAPENIANLIAGFVLMNDMSIPHTSFFRPPVKFKCLDGFLGVGSQLVSTEVAGDPALFKLEVRINGVLKQSIDFSNLYRDALTLLRDVNEFMTLQAGDVLMLGCDAGRPLAKVGDRIDITAPGLPAFGTLSHTLVAEGQFFDGPPLEKLALSGGSDAHAVTSVGATFL